MPTPLVHFPNAPVTETAVSLQFSPILGLNNIHLIVFWLEALRVQFPDLAGEMPPLDPVSEVFGEQLSQVHPPQPMFKVAGPDLRFLFGNADGSRLVQIQNGRIIMNWRLQPGKAYVRFEHLRDDLLEVWSKFSTFVSAGGMASPTAEQWEVVYVNRFEQGKDWKSPSEIGDILPVLIRSGPAPMQPEDVQGVWRFVSPDRTFRLHVALRHGWTGNTTDTPRVFFFTLTTRGPMSNGRDIDADLNRGHDFVVDHFVKFTSETAQSRWRTQ